MLSFLDELDDFFLDVFWEVEVVHSGVDCVYFLLQDDCFLVDVVDEHG